MKLQKKEVTERNYTGIIIIKTKHPNPGNITKRQIFVILAKVSAHLHVRAFSRVSWYQ